MAERVLSVLPLGDNVYFNTQAQLAFTNLCLLLHGMADEKGHGLPFNLEDLAAQLGTWRGLRGVEGAQPVCYPRLPPDLVDGCNYALKRNDQSKARGLHRYKQFVVAAAASTGETSTTASSIQDPARPARRLRIVGPNPKGGRPRESARLPPDVSSDPQSQ